ncbi:MAG: type II CRISPR RNA-guided endonuclease Cas9, partial [Propionibacteriaceae bacterium]
MIDSSFRYRVGVDVGYRSLGLAAIEYSAAGQPLRILNAQVVVHDAGIDPEENKTAKTRKETAGVARRVRRMIQRKAKRLKKLDQFLKELGFPTDPYPQDDPYLPWRYRAELATHPIADPKELAAKLSVALRHIARHRGWRSPYDRVENLFTPVEPSTELLGLRERTAAALHRDMPESATPGQIVAAYALTPSVKLRGPKGHLQGKLRQSDYAEEIRQIATMQGFDEAWSRRVIKVVFAAESPRGSALERVGFDPLPGQEKQRRAAKADSSFQRYRIASIICNIRITAPEQSGSRVLTPEEKTQIFDYLWNAGAGTEPSWDDVAAVIGLQRGNLEGVSKPTPDGERAGTRPPVYVTSHRILQCKSKKLQQWWAGAGQAERDCMIEAISFGGASDESTPESVSVNNFLESIEETELAELDIVSSDLPAGRAAYSADSMQRLTDRMLSTADDLHAARMHEFNVSESWAPPAEAIGAPVGNPAVDRVTKAFARWLQAVEREWGAPESVTIEHVRDGLLSEKSARELTRDMEKRRSKNEANLARMLDEHGASAQGRRWDYVRFEAVTRQNSQCAYCGGHIDFHSAEMDHILPQAGPGSNSRRENLLAACHRCNLAKGKIPFAAWAASCGIPGVSVKDAVDRVKHWTDDPKVPKKQALKFRNSVIARLKRTDADPEIDARSMESIAWMATELRHRVSYHFKQSGAETKVDVYRGGITSEARKASGLEWSLPYYGASGKTRLDRRHHAVDAAVLTLLDASVAKTLAERVSIMRGEKYLRTHETWKTYSGA